MNIEDYKNKIFNEDCLIGMKKIEDNSVDMILCDLPYGTTDCAWDTIIPFEPLWEQYKRIIKDNGAIVLTASQPFTTDVIISNREWFKYEIIWYKNTTTGFTHAKNKPLKQHENILIFSNGTTVHATQSKDRMTYNPQGIISLNKMRNKSKNQFGTINGVRPSHKDRFESEFTNYPTSILQIESEQDKFHPTQKPVKLFEYLIKTYTNEGEIVMDNCMGSGTTAIASINTKRNFIGFEMNEEYFRLASERIENHKKAFNCEVGLFSKEMQQGSLF